MPLLLQNKKTESNNTFKISRSKNFNLLRHLCKTRILEGTEVIIFDYYENYSSLISHETRTAETNQLAIFQNQYHTESPSSLNTLWTGDADLRLYITTVQDG